MQAKSSMYKVKHYPGLKVLRRICAITFLLFSLISHAQQINYVATEIAREIGGPVILEDLTGDALLDLVNTRYNSEFGRELLIYEQQADGRFSSAPRPVEIKTEIIAVGFADLRASPGKELLLIASNGVFSLSSLINEYSGNLKPLLQWPLIADMPNQERVQFFQAVQDIDQDGLVDLLLPGRNGYGYFKGAEGETFVAATEFSTRNELLDPDLRPRGDARLSADIDINSRDGIRLEVQATQPSFFEGFVDDWHDTDAASDTLLDAETFIPPAVTADFNGDSRPDIAFLNVGLDLRGQINLLFQNQAGDFPATPDWQGPIDTRGDITLADIDGDALMDIVKLTGDGNDWDLYLYQNNAGRFNFDTPTQILRFSGYDVTPNFLDIDADGKPELSVSYYTIPVVEAIRNTSIVRTQLIYATNNDEDQGIFARRPSSRLDETFSADNVRGLAEQMSLRHDIDGDGKLDALYITAEGTLAARHIDTDFTILEQPFWQYTPNRSISGFFVTSLNGDSVPDLVLRHNSAVTLLVANP